MEKRFIIYKGFENQAYEVFDKILKRFNMKIEHVTDYGINITNSRCKLIINYESGLQIWLKITKYNIEEMIAKLCMFKGEYFINEYIRILKHEDIKEKIVMLMNFLLENFENELSE